MVPPVVFVPSAGGLLPPDRRFPHPFSDRATVALSPSLPHIFRVFRPVLLSPTAAAVTPGPRSLPDTRTAIRLSSLRRFISSRLSGTSLLSPLRRFISFATPRLGHSVDFRSSLSPASPALHLSHMIPSTPIALIFHTEAPPASPSILPSSSPSPSWLFAITMGRHSLCSPANSPVRLVSLLG